MRLFEGTPFDRPLRCDRCGNLESECVCSPEEKDFIEPGKQTAGVSTEKRKKGKRVTVVRGLSASQNDLPALLLKLKTVCGAGGTLKENFIEVQGNHPVRIEETLREIGYRIAKK